jgi:putative oxidoreductase
MARLSRYLQSMLRIGAAAIFIPHGTEKLIGFPSNVAHRPIGLTSQLGFAGVLELLGGTLMLLGLFTRPVACVLAGEMAVAYYLVHMPRGRWPILNGGELAVLFSFIWLFFAAAGAGPLSLDAIWRKRSA